MRREPDRGSPDRDGRRRIRAIVGTLAVTTIIGATLGVVAGRLTKHSETLPASLAPTVPPSVDPVTAVPSLRATAGVPALLRRHASQSHAATNARRVEGASLTSTTELKSPVVSSPTPVHTQAPHRASRPAGEGGVIQEVGGGA